MALPLAWAASLRYYSVSWPKILLLPGIELGPPTLAPLVPHSNHSATGSRSSRREACVTLAFQRTGTAQGNTSYKIQNLP